MKQSVVLDVFNGVKGHRESVKVPQENRKNLSRVCELQEELKKYLTPSS